MATPIKPMNNRTAGKIILTEVFKVVQRLNAAAGQSMVKKGTRSGTMTFNPKIIIAEDGSKHYTCFVEIYTQASSKAGAEKSMEGVVRILNNSSRHSLPSFLRCLPLRKRAIFLVRSLWGVSHKMEKKQEGKPYQTSLQAHENLRPAV